MARFMDLAQLPSFSFTYGGRPSAELLPVWRRETGADGEVSYSDPETGLRVTSRVRRFDDFPAVDWVVEFENRGRSDTPILEDILPLDAAIAVPAARAPALHHANGSLCQMDDFLPHDHGPARPAPTRRSRPSAGAPPTACCRS